MNLIVKELTPEIIFPEDFQGKISLTFFLKKTSPLDRDYIRQSSCMNLTITDND